jgi:hypothetical protein
MMNFGQDRKERYHFYVSFGELDTGGSIFYMTLQNPHSFIKKKFHCAPPPHLVCGPEYLSRYRDSLRAGRSGDRIPVGARFSAPVQTYPGAQPASYKVSTASFPGVKRSGFCVDHPPPSSAEVKETVELYLHSRSGNSWSAFG